MKNFMDENFLLQTETAQKLYHEHAAKMPIIDYHCHLIPQMVADDYQFKSLTEIWLGGDHYKWRAMRTNGVDERYCTGKDTTDWEKFEKWAETVPYTFRNPLYHWTHLELKTAFGINKVLNPKTAREIFDECNEKLAKPEYSARGMMRRYHVETVCTTDDPVDSLEYHIKTRESGFEIKMLPTWRPDKAMNIEKPDYADYLKKLGTAAEIEIHTFADLKAALKKRMAFFDSMGCRASDHALEYVMYARASDEEVETIFAKRLGGEMLTKAEELKFKTAFMLFVGKEYARLGWAMQLHYGCRRDNNVFRYEQLGPDTGYDCIDNYAPSGQMADFLNALNASDELPKTIIYSLNPNDNAAIGTILGCFQDSGAIGKIQQGSAWWFNDHKTGMIEQMTSLANLGLLGNFIGMLTDSRSFLSYTRHEYFRRILCELIGGWVENGEYPSDMKVLGKMVEDISYNNAVRYFGFDLETK